ncbi:hypothetical protein NM208_g7694 [Fusarium decemcellulare]|uniref:Uncharacterized protein n=1 Tax=Fusarium decemcellulare TaxID=57161 RepID=A0ACC1S891_9HYPO|nr:hypothetical protein NM208_g7694 [Fusarium decemcellulare]
MLRFLPCYQAVENLRKGMSPTEAAEDAVRRMLRKFPKISSGIVVVDKHGEHGAAGSGWTFTYSYRGGSMDETEVVTSSRYALIKKWNHLNRTVQAKRMHVFASNSPRNSASDATPGPRSIILQPAGAVKSLLHNVIVGCPKALQTPKIAEKLYELPPQVCAPRPAKLKKSADCWHRRVTLRHVKCGLYKMRLIIWESRCSHQGTGDNTRPCTRCARNGVECLSEWIRFKHQPPKIRLSTAANAISNEYKFSADQTWCSPEGELEFVDEGKGLQSMYQTSPNEEAADSSQDDSEQATTPRETGDQQLPDQQLNSLSLDPGPYISSYHDTASEASWPTDPSNNRLLQRPSSQQQASPASGLSVHSASDPTLLENFSPLTGEPLGGETSTPAHESSVYRSISVWPLKDPVEARLMRYFIEKVARGFDLCDPERHFALVVPWRAAYCPPLLDAALALSARYLSRTTDFDSYISNRYYQRCLNSLISTLGIADSLKNQDLFAAVVLLRTLEEIDGPLSGADPQSHLLGGHLFASASNSEHSSILWSPGVMREPRRLTSLRRAALMVAFRQEVYMAFACQRPVHQAFYLPGIDRCLDNPTDDGTWTNRILLHLVDTLKFCYGDEPMNPDQSMKRHDELVRYADEWDTKKPPSFNPFFLEKSAEDDTAPSRSMAPKIWILSDAAATGLLSYHLLRILLISFDPHTPRVGPSRSRFLKQQDIRIREEVKTCIGMAEGNADCAPHYVLASLSIAIAGDRFEERWEQDELMRFLKKAESLHGWSTVVAQRHLAEA